MTQAGIVKGREALRAMFEQYLQLLPPGTPITYESLTAAGDVVLNTWRAETDTFAVHLGVDTHVIRDGKIVGQTFAFYATPRGA